MKPDVYTGSILEDLTRSVDRAVKAVPTYPEEARSTPEAKLQLLHEFEERLSREQLRAFQNFFIGVLSVDTPQDAWLDALRIATECVLKYEPLAECVRQESLPEVN